MDRAIKVGNLIINVDRIEAVEIDDGVSIFMGGGQKLGQFDADSAEGKALAWFFGEADRALWDLGMTIDIVAEHEMKSAEAELPILGIRAAQDRSYAAMVRRHRGLPPFDPAEAALAICEGEGGAA